LIDEQKMNFGLRALSVAVRPPLQRMRDIRYHDDDGPRGALNIAHRHHKRSTILLIITPHTTKKSVEYYLLFSRDTISSISTNDIKLLLFFLEREQNGRIDQEIGRSSLLPRLILYDNEVSADHFVNADHQHHVGFVVSVGCRK
jgi:hypothetical protein